MERPARAVRFGPFELDLAARELRNNGTRVALTGQPFQVLEALAAESGRPVRRADLRQRLWPDHPPASADTDLHRAVERLRLALGDTAGAPVYIETLGEHGYRLNALVKQDAPGGRAVPLPIAALRPWVPLVAGIAVLVAAAVFALSFRSLRAAQPNYQQITFRRGLVGAARFAQGGAVLYSAQWDSESSELFLTAGATPGIAIARLCQTCRSRLFPRKQNWRC